MPKHRPLWYPLMNMTDAHRRHLGLLAAVGTLLLAAGIGRGQAWWNAKWPCRRAVTLDKAKPTGLPGDDIAEVTMPTGGLVGPGGRDIRVIAANAAPVAHRVLMMGPGDRIRLAFAVKPGVTRYAVYFGHPSPPKLAPAMELDIRRGVLLEMRAYVGGPITTFKQVEAAFARARKVIGMEFRDSIFLGHNPMGPQSRLCSLFIAHLLCPAAGEYTFATSSQDASFLLVDGKVVVSNGGRHRPQRRATHTGKVQLTKGLHEVKVYHVSTGGNPVVMAACRGPTSKRLWKIPPSAFAPVRRATPGMLTQAGRGFQADFLPVQAGEAFMANRYFQRYTFAAKASGGSGRTRFEWDFGDGQTAGGDQVEHVYLRPGLYKVTLKARQGTRTVKRSNRIQVSRAWDKVTMNRLDPVAEHARIASRYDFAAADPADLALAIALFERAKLPKPLLAAGDALVKLDSAPAAVLDGAMPVYARTLVEKGDPARAAASLVKASTMTRDPAVSAAMTVLAGRTALDAGDLDKGLALFNGAIRTYSALTTSSAIRDARIGIGDVWRTRGDYAKAKQAYESARPLRTSTFEKSAVRKGDLTRHAEDYLRQGKLIDAGDFLDKLEHEFPTERLEGFSTLLRVRLDLARRRYPAAAAEAEKLVRVNPRSNYAPQLLLKAAEAYQRQGKADLSRRTLARVADDYPESPLAAEARKKIAGP